MPVEPTQSENGDKNENPACSSSTAVPPSSIRTGPLHVASPTSCAGATAIPAPPLVLACGHRSVLIPKSRLVFPAWLVLLPAVLPSDGVDGDTPSSTTSQAVARWRSKKDWSRLGRAVRRLRGGCNSDGSTTAADDVASYNINVALPPSLPKTAMDRLVQNVPWIRPDVRRIREAIDFKSDEHEQLPLHEENRWDPQWTKSIGRMDDFIRRIYELVVRLRHGESSGSNGALGESSASRALLAAWNEFCRPADADQLLPLPEPTNLCEPSSTHQQQRVSHSHGESSPPCQTDDDAHDDDDVDDAAEARGNALGQYFCSSDSAARLVKLFLSESRRHVDGALADGPVHVTVVEPSCGDGRLLRQLIDALRDDPLVPPDNQEGSSIQFVGMDIDECVLEIARRRQDYYASHDDKAVKYVAGDFVSSRRSDWEATDAFMCDEDQIASSEVHRLVLMIGGPPYSAGAGSVAQANGDSSGTHPDNSTELTRRNLPLQFVEHALQEHGASVVCFLMPERYRRCQRLQDLLDRHQYVSSTLESDSLFHFQGDDTRCVRQPSILQCYQRKR